MRSRHRQATQRSERVQRHHKFFTRKYADTFAGANSVRPFDLHDEIIKAVPFWVLLFVCVLRNERGTNCGRTLFAPTFCYSITSSSFVESVPSIWKELSTGSSLFISEVSYSLLSCHKQAFYPHQKDEKVTQGVSASCPEEQVPLLSYP